MILDKTLVNLMIILSIAMILHRMDSLSSETDDSKSSRRALPAKNCGVNKFLGGKSRMVSAKGAVHRTHLPSMVFLNIYKKFNSSMTPKLRSTHCIGTIIDKDLVLTAGHCLRGLDRERFRIEVYIGEDKHRKFISNADKYEKYLLVKNFCIPPKFKTVIDIPENTGSTYDFGVLQMEEDFSYNDTVQPACFPPYRELRTVKQDPKAEDKVIISSVNTSLKYPYMTYINGLRIECKKNFVSKDEKTVMCIENDEYGTPCVGDSGAPIYLLIGNKMFLYGVVTYSDEQRFCIVRKSFIMGSNFHAMRSYIIDRINLIDDFTKCNNS